MNILVACEESQRVCSEFRKFGHLAYSCDILPTSGSHPEWHINTTVFHPLFHPDYFLTQDGSLRGLDHWDMIIAFPPCTHLCNSGQRWFSSGHKDIRLQIEAISFFMYFVNYPCPRIAIENPVGIMSTHYRKPDQIIHPWMFGDSDYKRTCLWLKGLPKLVPTDIVPPDQRTHNNWRAIFDGKQYAWNDPIVSVLRSKTYPGIAKAMASQWSFL